MKKSYGLKEVQFHTFLNSALDGYVCITFNSPLLYAQPQRQYDRCAEDKNLWLWPSPYKDTVPTALIKTNDGPKITQEEMHLQTPFSKLGILSPSVVSSQQAASQWVSHSQRTDVQHPV